MSTLVITIYNCKFLRSCATRSEEGLRWLSATSDPWCRCCRENISSRKTVLAFAAGSWRRPAGSWRPRREGIRRRTRPSAGERWCCARRATFFCRLVYHKFLSSLCLMIIFYVSSTVFCLLNFTQRSHYYKNSVLSVMLFYLSLIFSRSSARW